MKVHIRDQTNSTVMRKILRFLLPALALAAHDLRGQSPVATWTAQHQREIVDEIQSTEAPE